MSLKAGIWALRLSFESQRGGGQGGGGCIWKGGGGGGEISPVWKHKPLASSGPLPKNQLVQLWVSQKVTKRKGGRRSDILVIHHCAKIKIVLFISRFLLKQNFIPCSVITVKYGLMQIGALLILCLNVLSSPSSYLFWFYQTIFNSVHWLLM